jgi:hypothetical protein
VVISIRPGYDANTVLGYLREAVRGASNVLGQTDPSLADYLLWATAQLRTLGPSISAADLDDLVTTRQYWALVGLMDLAVTSRPGLAQLVHVEMAQRRAALEVAEEELSQAVLLTSRMPLAVVDTNVLLVLSDQLQGYDWHGVMGEKQDLQILVTIPMAVVDELDRLKRDRTPMKLNGKSPTRRSLAIQALRTLDEMFPDPRRMFSIEQPTEPIGQRVLFRILLEEPGHKRLPSVDAEVVDQTVALTAFGGRVKLITFDTGMRLRARAADLEARQLPDPEDD